MYFSYVERIPARAEHVFIVGHRSLIRAAVVGHVVVSDDIPVIETGLVHYLVIFRIDAVVPSYDVAKTESECIFSVNLLYICGDILGMFRKLRKFVPVADLWVCDYDDIVVCVILGILFHDKVVALHLFLYLLIEKVLALEG